MEVEISPLPQIIIPIYQFTWRHISNIIIFMNPAMRPTNILRVVNSLDVQQPISLQVPNVQLRSLVRGRT
jgi:hypothetical protein